MTLANGKEYKLAIRIAGVVDKSYDVSLLSASNSLKAFQRNMQNINGAFTHLDQGFDKIVSAGKACFHAITTAAAVAAPAVGAVAAAAVKVGSEFEAEMSTVQAISGATADELKELTEKARDVAQQTVFSAKEVGSAMEYMGMAGWKAQDMIDGIDGIISLAAASGEDLAMVSDIVTDSLTAMGQTAGEAGHFADIMAQAAMNSNTNVELMGETFKYAAPVAGALGYSMEDLATATGLMASSGIKGSLAGTSLRNIMTRMAKPTKESQDAMDALGLSLEDETGRMYSLMEIMQMLRKNFSEGADAEKMQAALTELAGLTDEQISEIQEGLGDLTATEEAFYAAELGGARGMSGLLAIANSSDEDFYKLAEAIYAADGAAEKMAGVRLDNLQGDVTILKDAVSDAGIELYYLVNDELRSLVQKVTEAVNKAKVKIPEVFKRISTAFPTFKRNFTRFAEPVFNAILNIGKWVAEHGRGITSIIAGIAAATAAFKIEKGLFQVFEWIATLGSFGAATPVILGIAGALGVLGGAVAAYNLHREKMIDENLAAHFGDVALSMKEIQEAAAYITGSDDLNAVYDALKNFEDLENIAGQIRSVVDELNKTEWKVAIGMELTEDETSSYKENIDTYIENAKEYAKQAEYAVVVNLEVALSGLSEEDLEQSNLVSTVEGFYERKQDELAQLGTQLNWAMTQAFNDGFLNIQEAETIRRIRQQMADIQEQLAIGEIEGNYAWLRMDYDRSMTGQMLTPDSFRNLIAEVIQEDENANAAFKESFKNAYAATYAARDEFASEEEYQAAIDELYKSREQKEAEQAIRSTGFLVDIIQSAYTDKAEGTVTEIGGILDEYSNGFYNWNENPEVLWNSIINEAMSGYSDEAILTLLDEMSTNIDLLKSLDVDLLSDESAAELQELLNLINTLQATGGDRSSMYKTVADVVLGSDAFDPAMKAYVEAHYAEWTGAGEAIPEGITEGIANGVLENTDAIDTAAAELYDYTQKSLIDTFAQPITVSFDLKIGYEGLSMQAASAYAAAGVIPLADRNKYIRGHADGGFVMNKELSWLAEEGPEAVVPLDGSARAVALWEQTGRLLGMESIADRYDLGDGSGGAPAISYSPTLQFYGGTPSREDLDGALAMSQEQFDEMMEQYMRTKSRMAY